MRGVVQSGTSWSRKRPKIEYKLELAFCRGWFCVEVKADDYFLADEVVLFAWVFHIEVEAVDEEVGLQVDGVSGLCDGDRDVDRLGDAVEIEVSCEQVGLTLCSRFGFETSNCEGACRDRFYIEEIGRLEVASEFFVIGESAGHINDDFMSDGGKCVAVDVEMAGEFFKSTVVAPCDLGANKGDG